MAIIVGNFVNKKCMNIILWFCQILIAVVFSFSGIVKSTQSREKIIAIGQTGVKGLSYPLIRFIAVVELFGVFGIILPWAFGICRVLTPIAASGFALIMLLAIFVHIKLGEIKTAIGNAVLLCICCLIAIMRFLEIQ